jgi:outer membrane beta-barrel protein
MKVKLILILFLIIILQPVCAKDDAPEPESSQEQVIEPDIYRRDINVPRIEAEDFEITAYYGVLDVEDFGTEPSYGLRAAYHITEDFFLEGAIGMSETSDETLEDLTTFNILQSEDINYYSVSIGYNIFPGEIFLGRDFAMTSSFYLMFGVGNVEFNDEDEFAYNIGFGMKVLPKDWLSLRVDVRDIVYETDLLGDNEFTNNFEITGNIGVFF